ncbi:carboxypeptidase-like regulatory domain-containing protein [Spongiimicrobium salis]|uniref:carboxypeptidase-like regulatory domain-containing protein n=1 Tax=Spongiimicrobium salis TaxID=1667022 RepID=UPI00374D0B7F
MIQKIISYRKKFLTTALVLVTFLSASPESFAAVAFQDIQQAENNFNQYDGKVVDSQSKKALVFASISIDGTNISTVTNTEGDFTLKVPKNITTGTVSVSFLGYKSKSISLSDLKNKKNRISLDISVTELSEVNISIPRSAEALVMETLAKKGDNYFDDHTVMTAFYRETIKRRRRNVSLSEAVVNIYKTPYTSKRRDAVKLYKARKSTDYSRLDTVALKLQGGPFNALFVDIIKYPQYIFAKETIGDYSFTFDRSTQIDGKLIYVINFKQKKGVFYPLYHGKLYIDADKKILTSAIYSLNVTDRDEASKLFVRKKPSNASVYPTEVAYRVDYREKDGRWYYSYSNVQLEFKINWDKKLFNSVYRMTCEMAVTDWEKNLDQERLKSKERIRSSIILSDEAIGFADPNFWGEYNIIEPEKSIESAIKKIQRQMRRANRASGNSKP